MFNKWDSVLAHILNDVKDKKDIQLIGCYRPGRNAGNETPVTVLIIAGVNSTRGWRDTRDIAATKAKFTRENTHVIMSLVSRRPRVFVAGISLAPIHR